MKGFNKIFFRTYAVCVATSAGIAWIFFLNAAFQLPPSNNGNLKDLQLIEVEEEKDHETLERYDAQPLPIAKRGRRITATVTAYSPAETCPEGKSEYCLNASGSRPVEGYSVACPRALRKGTEILLLSRVYTCDDRTALRFDGRFDIFLESYEEASVFGKQQLSLFIYD